MSRPSPFAHIPPDKQNDFRFLLEKVYDALVGEIDSQIGAVKSKVGEHIGKIEKLEGAVIGLEVCPCTKRHNPGEKCPLFILESDVLKSKWRTRGIYIGCFTCGAAFYYLMQLALAFFKGH